LLVLGWRSGRRPVDGGVAAPPLSVPAQAALVFALSAVLHAVFSLPFLLVHRILTRLTGLDVK
jgi:hypothetical protein